MFATDVTLIVPKFPKISETFIAAKFVGLVDRGLDVRIVTQEFDQLTWDQFPSLVLRDDLKSRVYTRKTGWKSVKGLGAESLSLHVLGHTAWAAIRYLFRGLKQCGIRSMCKSYTDLPVVFTMPRIVHFEFGSLATARPRMAAALGAKMSASFRGYDLNYVGLDDSEYYDAVWASLDAAHFLGKDLHQRALRRGLPLSVPCTLIPPSIDTDFFSPLAGNETRAEAPSSDELRLLSVGRLEWKKGYEYALMAVRHLLDRGIQVRYRIIGAGEYADAVRFAVHQLGLQTSVELMGAMSPDRVRAEMSATDLFLHAAVSEGFCNAVLEAQSMELPVVVSDADGLPENVAHGVTGLVVPRRDPEAMADAAENLAKEPELRRRMGRAGRARVVERFQLADQIDRFHQYYTDLLGRSRTA